MDEAAVDNAWRTTCRALLGGEVGPISKCVPYLKRYVTPVKLTKSVLSGKEVAIMDDYPEGAGFISHDEMPQYSKLMEEAELSINEIKDTDSIRQALKDKFYYAGNNQLGKSSNIHRSTRVIDSHYVQDSHEVVGSKYIAYCCIVKYSEHVFGSENVSVHTGFTIKSYETYEASGLFGCFRVYDSSHCTYSANLENCADCLFCFNLRSRRRCIGNLELPQDKFNSLKSKLLEEIRSELEEKREVPEIMDIIRDNDERS